MPSEDNRERLAAVIGNYKSFSPAEMHNESYWWSTWLPCELITISAVFLFKVLASLVAVLKALGLLRLFMVFPC